MVLSGCTIGRKAMVTVFQSEGWLRWGYWVQEAGLRRRTDGGVGVGNDLLLGASCHLARWLVVPDLCRLVSASLLTSSRRRCPTGETAAIRA